MISRDRSGDLKNGANWLPIEDVESDGYLAKLVSVILMVIYVMTNRVLYGIIYYHQSTTMLTGNILVTLHYITFPATTASL